MAVAAPMSDLFERFDASRALLVEAYQRGFQDGVAATKAVIASADVRPMSESAQQEDPSPRKVVPPHKPSRIRPITQRILFEQPGLAIYELAEAVTGADPTIGKSSVRNELVRYEGKFYRRDGRQWFALPETGNSHMTR